MCVCVQLIGAALRGNYIFLVNVELAGKSSDIARPTSSVYMHNIFYIIRKYIGTRIFNII
jgi:hypothetical protein